MINRAGATVRPTTGPNRVRPGTAGRRYTPSKNGRLLTMVYSIHYRMYVKLDPMRLAGTLITSLVFALAVVPLCSANDLRATTESQLIQNRQADEDNLSRIEDSKMLDRFVRLKLLTAVPSDTSDYYLANVPSSYRYARPWTKLFIDGSAASTATALGPNCGSRA